MGRVYLAKDMLLDRQVAIKVVNLALVEQNEGELEGFSDRLIREARIAAALDHPGIVAIYQVGRVEHTRDTPGEPYIVMQFIDGPDLDSLLARKRFEGREAIRILKEVGAALDHAHEKGVIHRDIKPANIMLANGQTVKLCDFGIAKSNVPLRKVSSVLMGTPQFMAPEQLMYRPHDRRTDQWALAVVAYLMLSGRLPFRADDGEGLASQICYGSFRPLPELDPTVAPKVIEVLNRALSKDPEGRFATCSNFTAELAHALRPSPRREYATRKVLGVQGPTQPGAEEAEKPAGSAAITEKADPGHHYLRGVNLTREGKFDSAAVEYREVLRLQPDHAEARRALGFIFAWQDKYDLAIAECREALRLKPDDAATHLCLGRVFYQQDKHEPAIGEYREALSLLDPDDAGVHFYLDSFAKHDESMAEYHSRKLIRRYDPKTQRALAFVFYMQGKYELAIAAYQEALRLEPDDAKTHFALGFVFYLQDEYKLAIAEYREALRLKPDDAEVHGELGDLFEEQGKSKLAIAEYEASLRLNPHDAFVRERLGTMYLKRYEYKLAVAEFREAVRLNPKCLADIDKAWNLKKKDIIGEILVAPALLGVVFVVGKIINSLWSFDFDWVRGILIFLGVGFTVLVAEAVTFWRCSGKWRS